MIIMVSWCSSIILVLISIITIRVQGQLDSHGFLSIDCGLAPNSTFVETEMNFTFVSDEKFTDTGNISQISSSFVLEIPGREFQTVRYFPTGVRNCYTISSLIIGFKYLVRGLFVYGNYDNLNKPPIFDIYLGVTFWFTVNTSSSFIYPEIIFTASASYVQVCLVNKGLGNPFISSLHLRQVKKEYRWVNATHPQISLYRYNLGASSPLVRYPDDSYDRFWWSYTKATWGNISTTSPIAPDSKYDTPTRVVQTAATTLSIKEPLFINMTADTNSEKVIVLHFAEIQSMLSTDRREFDIYARGYLMYERVSPGLQSSTDEIYDRKVDDYSVSLHATGNSTLPPLLNAIELFKVVPLQVPTDGGDVSAINTIKEEHRIIKGWSGDPCFPMEFRWSGIDCSSKLSNRITGLNLSSSKLAGPLSVFFGKLTALELLDLSNNDLSGSLPAALGQLTALAYLDIRGNNKILTTLPPALQKKVQDGSLIYRFDDKIPSPPPASSSSTKMVIIIIAVVVAVLGIAGACVLILTLKRRKSYKQRSVGTVAYEGYESNIATDDAAAQYYANAPEASQIGTPLQPIDSSDQQVFPNFQKCQFSYDDLSRITNGFKTKIGTGGFGSVYFGTLENKFSVAVKTRSHWSKQGVKEFLAEAENLTRVHHKNLVSLMGYCIDKNCTALVYEYMPKGNLYEKLQDKVSPLTWIERLRIAYKSALGLEYLHIACNPPIIHRDVKTSNILLSENLEAKIADFGLSRAFNDDNAKNPVSTKVAGTPGYLDPEYFTTTQLSTTSDVFSFGVVLLEIITGRPPIGVEGGNLVQWVHSKLSEGNIRNIVDPAMLDKYDVNSVWKVTELACKCTSNASSERPTMSIVVSELKESLHLENSTKETRNESSAYNLVTDISLDSIPNLADMSGMPVRGPTVR